MKICYLFSVTTTVIFSYNCIGCLFLSKTSPNNGWLVKRLSKAILLIVSPVLLLVVRKTVFGFMRIFISIFSFVTTSFPSDTKAFRLKRLTEDIVGNKCAEMYNRLSLVVEKYWIHKADILGMLKNIDITQINKLVKPVKLCK